MPNPALAKWSLDKKERLGLKVYVEANATHPIEANRTGNTLPAVGVVDAFNKNTDDQFHQQLLESTHLFTDLPPKFFSAYLKVQKKGFEGNGKPISVPKIMQDKKESVLFYFQQHPSFSDPAGVLHIDQWHTLGWSSKDAYEAWLNTSMLFAFTHCTHYCSAPRVFVVDIEKNKQDPSKCHFTQCTTDSKSIAKKTNIFSVSGFEYRGYSGSIEATLDGVKEHSRITMQQILEVAARTNTTDIVFIPYGMGVFLPWGEKGEAVKKATLEGMVLALSQYKGAPITLQCCANCNTLRKSNNDAIRFEDRTGYDAYTVANDIQDRGDAGEIDPATGRPLKSMLINAADNDWTAGLDLTKLPGTLSNGHDLYDGTSDEYYALVMAFGYFSISRLINFYNTLFDTKITHLQGLPEVSQELHSNQDTVKNELRQSDASVLDKTEGSTTHLEKTDLEQAEIQKEPKVENEPRQSDATVLDKTEGSATPLEKTDFEKAKIQKESSEIHSDKSERVVQLNQVRRKLDAFKAKQNYFDQKEKNENDLTKKKGYADAKNAVELVSSRIESFLSEYSNGSLELDAFKEKIRKLPEDTETNKALVILETHRGIKQLVVDILTAIATWGISVAHGLQTGNYSWFKTSTDSSALVKELNKSIEKMEPPPKNIKP